MPSFTDIADNVAGKIKMIYDKANTPNVFHSLAIQMIHDITKNISASRGTTKGIRRISILKRR